MRNIFVLGVGLAIAYWLDQRYFGGLYSRATADMLHQITASFSKVPPPAACHLGLINSRD